MWVTVVGAVLQAMYLSRYKSEIKPVRQRLELSGDMAQLICTVISVVPPALVLGHGTLLTVTIIVAFGFIAVAIAALSNDQLAPFYSARKFLKIFMPASWIAFGLCGIGLVVALR
jgi:hypothetical protein